MTSLLRYHLSILLLFTLSIWPLSAQGDRDEERRPQISLAGEMFPLSHWFQHVPPSLVDFQGIVLTEAPTITYHPVLPYIFFDSATTQIPDRYVLYGSPVADGHAPEPICAEDIACHHHVLNIIGARLRRHPDLAITIVGYNAESRGGEDSSHSQGRAESVRDYLHHIWGIGVDRMVIRAEPRSPIGYSMSAPFLTWRVDARRVEIEGRFGTAQGGEWNDRELRRDSLNQMLFGPVTDSAMGRVVLPTVIKLDIDHGADPDQVAGQHLEVRFNDSLIDRLVDMYPRMESLSYALMRAVPDVMTEGEGVLAMTLVIREAGGEVRRSPELRISVLTIPASEARDRFATERRVVQGRVISGLWREDPNPFGSVARGTIRLFQKQKIEAPYRLSVFSSVDSLGLSDRRHRLTHMASLAYASALRPAEGETQLESQAAGLASGGLLGFSLPEERVIGESTYIVLDFPRCVDSVDVGECRFRRRGEE